MIKYKIVPETFVFCIN